MLLGNRPSYGVIITMARNSDLNRIQRLDELTSLLRAGSHRTTGELATALGVSVRTLSRDLGLLRDRGVPVEADSGRGGGVRLHRQWTIGPIHLDYREAVDVLLSVAITEKLGSALFLRTSRSVRNKLAATFSPAHREKIRLIRSRILLGEPASSAVLATYRASATAASSAVHEGFFEMRKIEIVYLDVHRNRTNRVVEPQFLCLCWPAWYLLAWDELRQDIRCFRTDRIQKAEVNTESFRLRDERPFLQAVGGIGERL